jgi:uncharacterized protein YaaR (DUF327 family)
MSICVYLRLINYGSPDISEKGDSMRIEPQYISNKDKLKKNKKSDVQGSGFNSAFQELEGDYEIDINRDQPSQSDLQNLAGIIQQMGESLSNNPTPENFNHYKKHIKLFITLLQDNFEIKDTISRISFSKQKLYKTVENVDAGLSELAQLILTGEKNRLSYLKLVNNIKGLIIDLIL